MGYIENRDRWLESDLVDARTKDEIRSLDGHEEELEDRFDAMMEFGTAGLRGLMRAGSNGMNIYTVRHATQAFSDVINSCFDADGNAVFDGEINASGASRTVVIAYDCRNNSRAFAEESACVLAANGIKVYLFDALRPTPELSFAIRNTGSVAGINITASHNPKEYNGYKAYWSDGAQLGNVHAAAVQDAMSRLDIFDDIRHRDTEEAIADGTIELIGENMDDLYMSAVLDQSIGGEYVREVADDYSVVYTPFHGCGYRLVPAVLRSIGIKNLVCVDEQMVIDGDFPTVQSPNPENVEGFSLAIEYAKRGDIDLIIGTDPDSDRCGIVVRKGDSYEALTGNQIGALLLDYIITVRREQGILPDSAASIKSIVTTQMANRICEINDVYISETLTGFRFIGERIKEYETEGRNCIFSFEESIGFLAGTYARDKDAVVAAMLIAEMGCWYRKRGMDLYQGLMQLYEKYGYFREKTVSHVYEGFDAKDRMSARMEELRNDLPVELGYKVKRVRDYLSGEVVDIETGERSSTGLARSDVLFFELDGGCISAIRPSGTEPKIKLYVMAEGVDMDDAETKLGKVIGASLSLLQ